MPPRSRNRYRCRPERQHQICDNSQTKICGESFVRPVPKKGGARRREKEEERVTCSTIVWARAGISPGERWNCCALGPPIALDSHTCQKISAGLRSEIRNPTRLPLPPPSQSVWRTQAWFLKYTNVTVCRDNPNSRDMGFGRVPIGEIPEILAMQGSHNPECG